MNKSENITTLAAALAKAQDNIGAAEKDAKGNYGTFADIASIMAACKPSLSAHGISIVQLVSSQEGGTNLETMLLHSSGEFISSEMRVVPMKTNDLQSLGAALTYCQRYQLRAMLCVPSSDDAEAWADRALANRPAPEETAAKREAITGPVVESFGHAQTAQVIHDDGTVRNIPLQPTPPQSTSIPDWRSVPVHWATKPPFVDEISKEPLALGQLPPALIEWLREKWLPKPKQGKKDEALALALEAAVKDGANIESEKPAEAKEVSTPPLATEKPVKAPKNAKPKASGIEPPAIPALEKKPLEWRSVVLDIPGVRRTKGKTLAEFADAKPGFLDVDSSNLAWLRSLYNNGIPKIEAKGDAMDAKDKVLVNAIKAACEEMKAFDEPEYLAAMNADDLREEIGRRFTCVGVSAEAINKLLTEVGIFPDEETTLDNAKEGVLRHVLANWPLVVEAVEKGDK